MEGASFLTGYTPRRGWFEEKARRRDEREAARVTRTEERGAGRERNDNPFDGHNAARHRKAHQTRNTANRATTHPPPPPPSRLLSRRPSIRTIFPQPSLSTLENLEAANLPLVICKPPSPRASHKLTELYYADPLVPLRLLQIHYIPTRHFRTTITLPPFN